MELWSRLGLGLGWVGLGVLVCVGPGVSGSTRRRRPKWHPLTSPNRAKPGGPRSGRDERGGRRGRREAGDRRELHGYSVSRSRRRTGEMETTTHSEGYTGKTSTRINVLKLPYY